MPVLVGFGNAFKIATACGDSWSTGIRFPRKGKRLAPVMSPVDGSYTCPPPGTAPSARYSLKSQFPVVCVQVDSTLAVGIVSRLVMPTFCRVPW